MASYKNFDFKKLYFLVYIALILLVVFIAFKLGIFLFPFTIALFLSILTKEVEIIKKTFYNNFNYNIFNFIFWSNRMGIIKVNKWNL